MKGRSKQLIYVTALIFLGVGAGLVGLLGPERVLGNSIVLWLVVAAGLITVVFFLYRTPKKPPTSKDQVSADDAASEPEKQRQPKMNTRSGRHSGKPAPRIVDWSGLLEHPVVGSLAGLVLLLGGFVAWLIIAGR